MKTWYKFIWADGTITCTAGYDRTEQASMERKHGKLIKKKRM